ncbi:MAG: hypothetical protein LBQ66_15350, partial [Planctomycetaceae bacterium]|nr:hypothetical protein [Planctomycetaceae bacterium]
INFSGKFPSEPKKYIGNIDVASAGKNKQIQMLCYVRPKYAVIPDKVYMYMPSEDSKYITDAVRTIRIESKQPFDIKSVKLQSAGSILSNVKWTLLEQNCAVRALGENIKYMTIQIEKVDDLTKQMTLEITIATDGGEIPLSLPVVLIRST